MDTYVGHPAAAPKVKQKRSITAREMGRRSAKARMIKLTPEQRSEIARYAITTRWDRVRAEQAAAKAAAEALTVRKKKRARVPATAA